jgi:hypothetical protein
MAIRQQQLRTVLKRNKKTQPGRHEGIDGETVSVGFPKELDKELVNRFKKTKSCD